MKAIGVGIALTIAFVAGCSTAAQTAQPQGPSPTDQELAFHLVWEGVYDMEPASRPTVTWYFDCVPDRLHVIATPECWIEQATPANGVELEWLGSFSSSDFSKGLDEWHGYLMNGKFVEWDLAAVARSQSALESAGL